MDVWKDEADFVWIILQVLSRAAMKLPVRTTSPAVKPKMASGRAALCHRYAHTLRRSLFKGVSFSQHLFRETSHLDC